MRTSHKVVIAFSGSVGATAPANTVAPAITGVPLVGETLTASDGTWAGTPAPTYTYQWKRDGVDIGSATNSTYVLVVADAGAEITVTVTATNAAGNASATSAATSIVVAMRESFTSGLTAMTETDTNAVISISGGQLVINGTPAVGSGLVSTATYPRRKGRAMIFATPTGTATTNRIRFGLTAMNDLGAVTDDYMVIGNGAFRDAGGDFGSSESVLANYEIHAIVEDTTGAWLYVWKITDTAKQGAFRRLHYAQGNAADLYAKLSVSTNAGVSQNWKVDEIQIVDKGTTFGDSELEVNQATPVSGTTYTCSGDAHIEWTVTAPNPLSGSASLKFRNVDANNYMIARFDDTGAFVVERIAAGAVAATPINVASVASAGETLTVQIPVGITNNDGQCITLKSGVNTKRGTNFDTTSALAAGANVIPTATDWTLGQLTVYDARDIDAYDKKLFTSLNLVIWDGDSIPAGSSATTGNDFPRVATKSLLDSGSVWYSYNIAVGGQTLATMASDIATDLSGWYSNVRPAHSLKQIVVCAAGTNDFATGGRTLSQLQADVQTYCAAVRAAGLKVIVCTIIARNNAGLPGDFETNRAAYNTWLVSNYSTFADGLADFAANAAFNEQADADNTTNYNADKVHPNTTGHAILAGIVKTAIDAVSA